MDVQDERLDKSQQLLKESPSLVPFEPPHLPPARRTGSRRRRSRWIAVALLILMSCAGGAGYYVWKQAHPPLPVGISLGNGRIEADEIDIDTKYAGRVAELLVDIGDMVSPGQVMARMDTRDIQQSLSKSEAQIRQAQHSVDEAQANLTLQQTQKTLADQEMNRTRALLKNGWTTREIADQRQQVLDGAVAGLNAAQARVLVAQHALEAAQHDAGFYKVEIADNTLIAPKAGRVQYRLTNIGEVLPAGGKVFTMLDVSNVYMDVYLPTLEAGKVKVGTDARIVLDAYPDHPIPAKVTFVASQAQFTPKTVETQTERDKLMFRIRARIDQKRLRAHADAVRSGLPGVAYIRWDPAVAWPNNLQGAP
ncbi:MAG TPA: HlyD family efflux transporter periplasmic adaptor subunit [Bradyrhizobium sp.]|uniref:HlyD family secretion protein n=1 Tax=Bradyrhizobium sp. TaxID=376 RepID=UPI002BD288F3|nr:HlyD family efflux transporter periplasmic adaptor subunit [Bradyrhizobium sp.]HLZ01051.1 HlyD family efflux transporter periplasmic adaptor subunit [Bradyrhizobium sp.]